MAPRSTAVPGPECGFGTITFRLSQYHVFGVYYMSVSARRMSGRKEERTRGCLPFPGDGPMKLSELIKNGIEKKGYKNIKEAARALGISTELLRVIISKGHIPKDNTLALMAKKLNIEMHVLVLAAHQEKVPDELKGFFLTPSPAGPGRRKRKYPLSEEQTTYLGQILNADE